MGLNAVQFAKRHGISEKQVKEFYEMGYLPNATRETRGKNASTYDIPEGLPCPHHKTTKISHLDALMNDLLSAANQAHSISEDMYPRLPEGTVRRAIDDLSAMGWIRVIDLSDDVWLLEIVLGEVVSIQNHIASCKANERAKKWTQIINMVRAGTTLADAALLVLNIVSTFAA